MRPRLKVHTANVACWQRKGAALRRDSRQERQLEQPVQCTGEWLGKAELRKAFLGLIKGWRQVLRRFPLYMVLRGSNTLISWTHLPVR